MSKLINCKDCGHQVSKNAAACPNCGAKIKRTSILTWVAAIFIGLLVISAVMSINSANTPSEEPEALASDSSSEQNIVDESAQGGEETLVEPSATSSNWQYDEYVDEMRGTTTYTATTMSKNEVYLDSPYGGGTNLGLIIRHSDEQGNEVLVVTNNGQLWCEYSNCAMTVKFDNEDVEQYLISRAAGGSSEAMFLDGSEESFADKLKNSDTMMLEIGFFNNGNQQFTFDVAGLEWSKF